MAVLSPITFWSIASLTAPIVALFTVDDDGSCDDVDGIVVVVTALEVVVAGADAVVEEEELEEFPDNVEVPTGWEIPRVSK